MSEDVELPLDHVNFRVRNLEKMYRFYHDVLGLKDVFTGLSDRRRNRETKGKFKDFSQNPTDALLSSDERHQGVELSQIDETELQSPGFFHFGFYVKNIDAWVEKLKARGVKFARITTLPYPNAKLQVKVAFFRDPEGNLVELIEWTELK